MFRQWSDYYFHLSGRIIHSSCNTMAPSPTPTSKGAASGQQDRHQQQSSQLIANWHYRCCFRDRTQQCSRSPPEREPKGNCESHKPKGTCSQSYRQMSHNDYHHNYHQHHHTSPKSFTSSSDLSHQRALLYFLYTTIIIPLVFTFICCQSLPGVGGNFGKLLSHICVAHCPLCTSFLPAILCCKVAAIVALSLNRSWLDDTWCMSHWDVICLPHNNWHCQWITLFAFKIL